MKKATKNILRIIISIVYILWGLWTPIKIIRTVIDLLKSTSTIDLPSIVTAAVGVLMLLAGIFGLLGMKKVKCRVFGIIIFVFAVVSVVFSLPFINVDSIVTAILAWLFIVCL